MMPLIKGEEEESSRGVDSLALGRSTVCTHRSWRGGREHGTDSSMKVSVVMWLLEVLYDCFYILSERGSKGMDGRRDGALKRTK